MAQSKSYYEQANPDLLYRIPVDATTVLEIGCGAGGLGRAYKAINPNVTYIGIEVVPEQAEKAAKNLDHVIEQDIEAVRAEELIAKYGQIDCLVCGDVLEHLIHPEEMLRNLLPTLKPEGLFLACIPNVQHWSVIANLIAGKWPQEDQGIFDRTHLRWFTRESIVQLTERLDIKIHEIVPRIFGASKAMEFARHLAPSIENLGLDINHFYQNTAPLQYVVAGCKKAASRIEICGLMLKPQAGMNEVRMIQPLRSVGSIPGVRLQLGSSNLKLEAQNNAEPKIMIWQRQLLTYSDSLGMIKQALKAGYLLISEFDDDPSHWPTIEANKNLNFTAMHAVQVSTQPLAEQIGKFNPEIRVFENCIERIPEIENSKWDDLESGKPFRIFFGALNRKNDWKDWMEPINAFIKNHMDRIEFEIVHDSEFYNALKTDRKRFTPTCNYDQYMNLLNGSHIALLPLNSTVFNHKKSDLKFVEAASNEVATIASPTVYSETIETNKTGKICERHHELEGILDEWIQNPNIPHQLAKNAREWCVKERLQKNQSRERLDWYLELWSRKDALTAELLRRVPELRDN